MYGDQKKLEEHEVRRIEKEDCNISDMHPNKQIKFNDWYMKIDPPLWIASHFECMNIPVDDNQLDAKN